MMMLNDKVDAELKCLSPRPIKDDSAFRAAVFPSAGYLLLSDRVHLPKSPFSKFWDLSPCCDPPLKSLFSISL